MIELIFRYDGTYMHLINLIKVVEEKKSELEMRMDQKREGRREKKRAK